MSDLMIRFLEKDEYPRWDKLVDSTEDTTIFDETWWLEAVSDIVQCNIKILGVFRAGELIGGVPLKISRCLCMPTATRIPLSPTNSIVFAPSNTIFSSKATSHVLEITDGIASFLSNNFHYSVLTNHPRVIDIRSFNWQHWKTLICYTYIVNLAEADFSKLTRQRRQHIRNAEKAGVSIERENCCHTAHTLLDKSLTASGVSTPLSAVQMNQLYLKCADHIVQFTARTPDGKPAAIFVCLPDWKRKIVHALFSGNDRDYNDLNASSFVIWKSIEYFKEQGLDSMDLVGAENKTIARFKAAFGGQLVPYFQLSKGSMPYRILNRLCHI